MNKPLITAGIIIAYLIGIGVGFYLTPEYAQMNNDRGSDMMELGNADRNLDLRYIDGMIAHHLSAIAMAEQAVENSDRSEIRELSHAIIDADTKDIERLYQLKKEWYGNTNEITEFQEINLGPKDEQFDLRFLNALIIHHHEAIDVAKDVQTKSYRAEVLNTASSVITGLSASLETLTSWRQQWYGIQ